MIFKVSTQFTDAPGGRYRKNGDKSGEELRDDYLIPLIDKLPEGEKLTVDLDDCIGFASSMLEETFGGLVRRRGSEVLNKIEIVGDREDVEEANQFMQEQAEFDKEKDGKK